MIRLQGGTHYLGLTRVPGKRHRVFMCAKHNEALAHCCAGTRISPVFALNGAQCVDFASKRTAWILFVGPLYPGDIDGAGLRLFLSLGAHNVLAISTTERLRAKARHALMRASVRWEEWEVRSGNLVAEHSGPAKQIAIPAELLGMPFQHSPALSPTVREYSIAGATTVGRALLYDPDDAAELVAFDQEFRKMLSTPVLSDVDKQQLLVIANAAISRHSSQTYAGTSPIRETECHFWPHSLLGVAIASKALSGLRRFVQEKFDDFGLLSRLEGLNNLAPLPTDLLSLPSSDDRWDCDHLSNSSSPQKRETLPLLTCFSGRDGFRSTKLSLSAPLEVITGCNTAQWTLYTLTHEISHAFVEGALGILLPDPWHDEDLDLALELLAARRQPTTLLEQLRFYLCHNMWQMSSNGPSARIGRQELAHIITSLHNDVNETLTHIFDFLYFYQSEPSLYIRSIWASWGVIPNIHTRVGEYITRSLCALYSTNTRKQKGRKVTIEQLRGLLRELRGHHGNSLVTEALSTLDRQTRHFENELSRRSFLTKLAKGFLYSPKVAQSLLIDKLAGSGEHEGYALSFPAFGPNRIRSPLRFVSAFTNDSRIDALRSAWMLTNLAFRSS